jgi:hypothetical protein
MICPSLAQPTQQEEESTTFLGRVIGRVVSLLPLDDLLTGSKNEFPQADPSLVEGNNLPENNNNGSPLGDMTLLSCTKQDTCFNDSVQTPGAYTCRPQYIGDITVCVPTVLGITVGRMGDTCGCCNGICPQKCECGCTSMGGSQGVLTHFSVLFGLLRFEQCLETTVAEMATSYTSADISCSKTCLQQ